MFLSLTNRLLVQLVFYKFHREVLKGVYLLKSHSQKVLKQKLYGCTFFRHRFFKLIITRVPASVHKELSWVSEKLQKDLTFSIHCREGRDLIKTLFPLDYFQRTILISLRFYKRTSNSFSVETPRVVSNSLLKILYFEHLL